MAIEWPFVGRVKELDLVRSLLSGRSSGGAVITGPAGVGKTRLALECLDMAETAGMATIRATATRAASSRPFGALAGALDGSNGRSDAVADWPGLLRQSEATLVGQSGGRRLVVFVDDAHLLDDASATLIHQLAVHGSAFVLATTRCADPAPDPVVALWKEGLAQRIELDIMPADLVEKLVTAVLGGCVDANAVLDLSARAQGNLLFLRELVLGALDDSVLVEDDGMWRLRGELPLSFRLIELVEARLAGATLAERALLELVAYGEPLGEAELNALADPDLAEALERRGLLASSMNGRRLEVRLSHPIYGEVLRAGVPSVRERAVARALAEVVEATGARRRDDVLRVASWRLVGGGGQPDMLLAGAVAARWHYDFVLAESLARAAVRAGEGFEAALLAAELTGLQGRPQAAERELADLVPAATDDARRARLVLTRIHNSVTWTASDPHHLLEAARESLSDPKWRDRLEAERLLLLDLTHGPRAVSEAAPPLIERATGDALAVACIPTAASLARLGHFDRALEISERGKAAHQAGAKRLAWYPWWHDLTRYLALHLAGRIEEAEVLAAAQYRRAIAERSSEAQTVFAMLPAFAVSERGRVRSAARRARESLELARRMGRPVLARYCYIYGAVTFALCGRVQEAKECLSALDDLALPPIVDCIDGIQARAWTAAAAGDLAGARGHLDEAASLGGAVGDIVGQASALHGLARLGYPGEAYDRLVAVGGEVEGVLTAARVSHTRALLDEDGSQLEMVSREFEAMGADLLAAEAAADAAVARRRAGEDRAAIASMQRASMLAKRCEFPVTPALQPVEVRATLTAPERETALLAASGLSNRHIADQLLLSVRTVENRLQRVYQKLGLTRRTELAEALEFDRQRRWS